MATVRELVTRFGFQVDQSSINRVEGSINRLSGMLGGLAGLASLKALADIGDSMQSLEARIGMLPQTIGNVGESFDTVAKHATDARQSIESYGSLYTRIGNAAKDYLKSQDDVLKVTDTISKALVVGGATMQEQSSVMIQFSQALGSGTLQGDEFRAMAEAAPQYLDALAKALGHPRSELKKLASEGKITTKDIIKATMQMSGEFEDKFRQMPLTIGQGLTQVTNKFSMFVARVNRESEIITQVATFITDNFDKIGFAIAAALTPLAVMAFGAALSAILSPIGALVGFLYLLYTAFFEVSAVTGKLQLTELGQDIADLKVIMYPLIGLLGMIAARFIWIKVEATLTFVFLNAGMLAFRVKSLATFLAVQSRAVATFLAVRLGAVATAETMAAAWTIALGPIGLIIAGIMAIIYYWKELKKFFSLDGWIGDANANVSVMQGYNVNKGSMAQSAGANQSRVNNIDAKQNINITVPAGTTESQQGFIEQSAARSYKEMNTEKIARSLGVFAL